MILKEEKMFYKMVYYTMYLGYKLIVKKVKSTFLKG